RVHPDQWADRLQKMKNGGLNTVQTYIPWNLHNPKHGLFIYEGFADIVRFVQLAQSTGLLVVLRLGPYSCGEWDFGGFPAWILKESPGIRLRSADPIYFEFVREWYESLLPLLKPLVYSQGGPVVLMQVETICCFVVLSICC